MYKLFFPPPKIFSSQETSRGTCGNLALYLQPSSDNLVHDDLRCVEVVKLMAWTVAGADIHSLREGPQDRRRVEAEAPGLGVVVGRGRRRRRLGLRRLVVHPRRLRAVGVEPRRDAHAHVQHLHVPRHLDVFPGWCRSAAARRR